MESQRLTVSELGISLERTDRLREEPLSGVMGVMTGSSNCKLCFEMRGS